MEVLCGQNMFFFFFLGGGGGLRFGGFGFRCSGFSGLGV